MAHRRSFRGRGISDSQRRKKSWIQISTPARFAGAGTTTAETSNLQFSLPLDAAPSLTDFRQTAGFFSDLTTLGLPAESTILRIRGSVLFGKNDAISNDVTMLAMGIGVLESTAAAAGVVPNPATPDGGSWDGWMWHRSQQSTALDVEGTVFDVKSMRKVQGGYSMILVFGRHIQNVIDVPVDPVSQIEASINLRVLVLLP